MNIYHFHAFFCQEIDIKDSPLLTRIFDFLERMTGSRDPEVVLVAGGNGVVVLAQRVQGVTTADLKDRSARGLRFRQNVAIGTAPKQPSPGENDLSRNSYLSKLGTVSFA